MYILSQLINRFYPYFDLVINIITGLVYGAKENKRLQVFIDDLNLPVPDEDGVQRCNEVHSNYFMPSPLLYDDINIEANLFHTRA